MSLYVKYINKLIGYYIKVYLHKNTDIRMSKQIKNQKLKIYKIPNSRTEI